MLCMVGLSPLVSCDGSMTSTMRKKRFSFTVSVGVRFNTTVFHKSNCKSMFSYAELFSVFIIVTLLPTA